MELNRQIKIYKILTVVWFVTYMIVAVSPIPTYIKVGIMALAATAWIYCIDQCSKKKYEKSEEERRNK